MSGIVDDYPRSKLDGGLRKLYLTDDEAVK